jgi:hypothetical protein
MFWIFGDYVGVMAFYLLSTFLCWPLALTTNRSCGTDTLDLVIIALYAYLSSLRGTPSLLLSSGPSRLSGKVTATRPFGHTQIAA